MITDTPLAMRERPQWICANAKKQPIDPHTGYPAKVNDPSTWGTFAQAKSYAEQNNLHVGFVFTKDDPYFFIDLDNKERDENRARLHEEIIKASGDTYIERSISGEGHHIVLRAKADGGRKNSNNGVELYPHERYMLVTGDCVGSQNIGEGQELVNYLLGQFDDEDYELEGVEFPSEIAAKSNAAIMMEAVAEYGQEFQSLCDGAWPSVLGHEDHSRADHRALTILSSYTADNEQVKEIFLQLEVGNRAKAHRKGYLDMSIRNARPSGNQIAHGRIRAKALLLNYRSDRLLSQSIAEFMANPVPSLKLIKNVIGEGGTSVLYGEPGAGKSAIALSMADSVATNKNWMGQRVNGGAVLIACGEGQAGFQWRMQGMYKANNAEDIPMRVLPVALPLPSSVEQIKKELHALEAKTGKPAVFAIFDTLARFFSEDGDENSTKDMNAFTRAIDSIRSEFPRLHIMIVHHSGKDQGRGMRGSSVLKGAVDTVLCCKRVQGDDKRVVIVEKQKDHEDGRVYPFVLESVVLGYDEDGDPITTCQASHDPTGREGPVLRGNEIVAVNILRRLRDSILQDRTGNLAGYGLEIPLDAYRNHWYLERPDDKKNSVKKNADNQLKYLREKQYIDWPEGGANITLLPAFDSICTEV